MAKWTSSLKKPWRVRGWGLVFLAGIVLTILAMIDAPAGNGTSPVHTADNSTGCQLRVSAAELVVDGTRVVTDGFRELEGDRWAADQFLTPMPNTNCS